MVMGWGEGGGGGSKWPHARPGGLWRWVPLIIFVCVVVRDQTCVRVVWGPPPRTAARGVRGAAPTRAVLQGSQKRARGTSEGVFVVTLTR